MASFEHHADAALLADRTDPAGSFSVFYRRHARLLLLFCVRRGLGPDDAADVIAETFAVALLQRYRYRPERETAAPWLLTIAARRIGEARRRHAREHRALRRLAIETPPVGDEDRAAYGRLEDRVLAAVAELPAEQRDALERRFLADDDYAAIAGATGVSEPAARKRVSRGLAALRTRLTTLDDPDR